MTTRMHRFARRYIRAQNTALISNRWPGAIPEPKYWLNYLPLGDFKLHVGGIGFVTGSFVPFIIQALIFFVVVASFIMLIVGATMWISSQGEKEGLAKAKATVTYALLGLALGVASTIIIGVIEQVLNANLGVGSN